MALDEPKDNDDVYEIDGFRYLVNKEFMEKVKPIKVEFSQMGFRVTANIDLSQGCKSCGTSSSCSC